MVGGPGFSSVVGTEDHIERSRLLIQRRQESAIRIMSHGCVEHLAEGDEIMHERGHQAIVCILPGSAAIERPGYALLGSRKQ